MPKSLRYLSRPRRERPRQEPSEPNPIPSVLRPWLRLQRPPAPQPPGDPPGARAARRGTGAWCPRWRATRRSTGWPWGARSSRRPGPPPPRTTVPLKVSRTGTLSTCRAIGPCGGWLLPGRGGQRGPWCEGKPRETPCARGNPNLITTERRSWLLRCADLRRFRCRPLPQGREVDDVEPDRSVCRACVRGSGGSGAAPRVFTPTLALPPKGGGNDAVGAHRVMRSGSPASFRSGRPP